MLDTLKSEGLILSLGTDNYEIPSKWLIEVKSLGKNDDPPFFGLGALEVDLDDPPLFDGTKALDVGFNVELGLRG